MPPGRKTNPYSKVTEETSEPEHERRLIRAKAVASRKKAEKSAQAARKARPASTRRAADEASSPSNPATKAKRSPQVTPLPPVRKKRSGLRGVALTFGHYGVKKVVRRPSAVLSQRAKVPRVAPLPGQEGEYIYVPLSDSNSERGDEATDDDASNTDGNRGDTSGAEVDDTADADGEADTWEKGSQTSTVIEDASDREDFDTEYGVPGGSTEKENQEKPELSHGLPRSEHIIEANTTHGHVNGSRPGKGVHSAYNPHLSTDDSQLN